MALYDTQTDAIQGQEIVSSVNTPDVVTPITVSTSDVYSADNINSSTSKKSSDPYDLLNIRSNLYNTLGVTEAQNQYNEQLAKLYNLQNTSDAQQLTIEGQPVNMNMIRGEQARALELANYGITAQSRVLEAYASKLSGLKSEAEAQYTIRANEISEKKALMQSVPGAGIKYSDSYEQAIEKINKYQVEQEAKAKREAEEAEAKAYKKYLKEQLLALGSKVKGLSTNELENKLRKKNKKALEAAEKQAKQEYDMKIEEHNLSMENIRSTIANRGKSSGGGFDISDKTEVQKMVYEAASSGESWYDIVQTMGAAGADIDFVDKILKQIYGYSTDDNNSRSVR